jgi:hypothetical protein
MAADPLQHRKAAKRHREAAAEHDKAADFWTKVGDERRADLQRRLAEYERTGALLEDEWSALSAGA